MEKGLADGGVSLSVIIITKNEAAHIKACLDSVAFADEVVVLDSGSTDATVEIARAWGARVSQSPDWPGFGPQKNRVLDMATGDWVFSIDADERVTPELAAEIQAVIREPRHDAYKVARLSELCGRKIRHSGWWPDHVLRLFKRGTARFTDVAVHEKVVPQASAGVLVHHLLHFPYPDLESLINKSNRYSSDAAAAMHARGKRTSPLGMLGHGIWTFIRIYFLRRGFLDGRQGLVLALFAASGSIFRYAKLMFIKETGKGA